MFNEELMENEIDSVTGGMKTLPPEFWRHRKHRKWSNEKDTVIVLSNQIAAFPDKKWSVINDD